VQHAPSLDREEPHPDTLPSYSKSDFPDIRFWTKSDWLDFKNKGKDSSTLRSKAGPQGGTRCAQGTNISMIYLKDTNREPIDGRQAADIHEFARKIWACFYNEEIAPTKWGDAEKKVKDRYTHEMELW
jgi:hypothetical protein